MDHTWRRTTISIIQIRQRSVECESRLNLTPVKLILSNLLWSLAGHRLRGRHHILQTMCLSREHRSTQNTRTTQECSSTYHVFAPLNGQSEIINGSIGINHRLLAGAAGLRITMLHA